MSSTYADKLLNALADNQIHNDLITTILTGCDLPDAPAKVLHCIDIDALRDALTSYHTALEAQLTSKSASSPMEPSPRDSDRDTL